MWEVQTLQYNTIKNNHHFVIVPRSPEITFDNHCHHVFLPQG